MMVLKVTPVRNVLIGKRCFKSKRADMLFNKDFGDSACIEVFDVSDRKQKLLLAAEINKRNHRMIINDKRYFICSVTNTAG